ncbi:MAG: haloacid dehalogenase-like hydrolase, partial [Prevotella sp.]|nr:haloacid dehalogenase-like hydrolase [Prevotella sp.]
MNKTKKLWMLATILILCGTTATLASCSKDDDSPVVTPAAKEYFTQWNQCEALTALQNYVKDVTDVNSPNYIQEEDRIATFDMDGTFVGELYPSYFEYNLLEYRALDDPDYEAPKDVMETAQEIRDFVRNGKPLPDHFDMKHAYAAAKAYAGMTLAEFDAYVKAYAAQPANGFSGMTYGESFYKPMLEVFDYLKGNGFTCYVVSGSDRFICRALTEAIGIPSNRVIGMDVRLVSSAQGTAEGVNYTMGREESILRTDELIIKNLKTNKVKQIAQEIGKVPVLSFGNSGGDAAMHNYALSNPKYKSAAFMLIADDDVRDHANREKALKLGQQWREAGYHVISMRDDFKTIYGEGVTKTDFSFPIDTKPLTEWQAGRTVSQEAVEAFGGIDKCFAAEPIPDGVWQRMQGKTFKENPYIGRDDLRHIRALHWDYDNQMHV